MTWRIGLVCGVVSIVCSASPQTASAQLLSFGEWQSAALPDALQAKPRSQCAALTSLTGYEFSIISATVMPAGADAPEHCRITGLIQPEIRFELLLPAVWNGHLYMFGNGGYAGEALQNQGRAAAGRRAVGRGFAVAQTNTGHDAGIEPLGTFATSPQKFLDYAYRAVHVTALTAKTFLKTYYAEPLRHAYFDGCSTGGRQGLMSAQRFPEDFDGIVVGAPVLNFSGTMISYATSQRALAAAPLTPEKLKIVSDTVYGKCDAADAVPDGVIDDPRRCTFKPSTDLPRCAGDTDGPACFTSGQIRTLETIYGSVTRGGAEFFPGWPAGAEVAAPGPGGGPNTGWLPWFLAPPNSRPIQANFGETFFRYMAFGKATADYDWLSFDLEKDLDRIQGARAALDATDPDLSRFKSRGGKIVSYYGWADPALNPMMGVGYYENVVKTIGPSTADFYRMFMVPGMFHCGGGVGVNSFDPFTALVRWVEQGSAPAVIPAARVVSGKTLRTRPLCPYPEVARYKGSGSTDEAANFACVRP